MKTMARWMFFAAGFLCAVAPIGIAAAGGAPSGFVGVEQDSAGIWWFTSPDGKPFLSFGINHVEPVYWQSPNNKAFVLDTYGPELFAPDGTFRDGSPAADRWAQRVAESFQSLGFNTFGFHTSPLQSLRSAGSLYHVVLLDIPVPWGWNMSRTELVRAFQRRPTDVFAEDFAAVARANAAEVAKPRANDPQVLGYVYTDGPPWTVEDDKNQSLHAKLSDAEKIVHPWCLALMSLPAEAQGKQAWLAMMQERYSSPEEAGKTYGASAKSWDDLAARTAWASVVDAAKAAQDSRMFLERIMRQWYAVRRDAIRQYDRNHLILGDKLNMNRDSRFPAELIRNLHVMREYVDVVNVQYYGVFGSQRETLELLYRESQKPILNGDTTFNPMWKDDDPDMAGYYRQLGGTFEAELRKLFSLPYFIGWHHCGYMRGLRLPYRSALESGNRSAAADYEKKGRTFREGFFTESEEPIKPLTVPLGRAISSCEVLHRASSTSDNQRKKEMQ